MKNSTMQTCNNPRINLKNFKEFPGNRNIIPIPRCYLICHSVLYLDTQTLYIKLVSPALDSNFSLPSAQAFHYVQTKKKEEICFVKMEVINPIGTRTLNLIKPRHGSHQIS